MMPQLRNYYLPKIIKSGWSASTRSYSVIDQCRFLRHSVVLLKIWAARILGEHATLSANVSLCELSIAMQDVTSINRVGLHLTLLAPSWTTGDNLTT